MSDKTQTNSVCLWAGCMLHGGKEVHADTAKAHLASLRLAWEIAPPTSAKPWVFVRAGFHPSSLPRAAVVQPALQKVLLCAHCSAPGSPSWPPAATSVLGLKAISPTKCLRRVGIPEKDPSLGLALLLSGIYFWADYKQQGQLLPHLKIALEKGLTVPWPAVNCNRYS